MKKTFQDADFTLKATKEILGLAGDVIGTTVDHAKSFARRGLRVAGMDAGNAQDFVDMAEIATCVAPVMKGAYGLAASTKVGVKTASALRGAVHDIKSAARFGMDVLEDYAQFKARGPQLVYARSRTFDRSYAAPKRAHSSIFFQEKSSHFESQRFSQSSKAPAAPKAQQAPAAGATVEKISRSKTLEQAAQDVRDSFNSKLNTKGKPYSEWYIERQMKGAMGEKAI